MATNDERAQLTRLNRLLEPQGQLVRKIRQDSRWYAQYGPFTLVDLRTNGILRGELTTQDLDQLEDDARLALLKAQVAEAEAKRRSEKAGAS